MYENSAGQLSGKFVVFLLALAGVGGCATVEDLAPLDTGTTDEDTGGGRTDTGTDIGGTPDVGPECVQDIECPTGQFCQAGACVAGCGSGPPCVVPTPVCDPSLLVCVECGADTDCAPGETCVAHVCEGTTAGCASDADCPMGETCNMGTGVCEGEPGCSTDADCGTGEMCAAGACVSDNRVCTPNEATCVGNTLVQCNADGTMQTEMACGSSTFCVGGTCTPQVCAPATTGCVNATTRFSCDVTGTIQNEETCDPTEICQEGECVLGTCDPGTTFCAGSSVVVCDMSGTPASSTDCTMTATCLASEFGCTCDTGLCVELTCTPGDASCEGDAVVRCAMDGRGYNDPVPCDPGQTCTGGMCMAAGCSAGATSCSGNTLLTCNAGGTGFDETDCAASGQACVAEGASASCQATCADDIYEQNDSRDMASSLAVDIVTSADSCAGDDDWWGLGAQGAGVTLTVTLNFLQVDGNLDVELYRTGSGTPVASGLSATDNEEIVHEVAVDDTYWVRVFRNPASGGGGQSYTISFHPEVPMDTCDFLGAGTSIGGLCATDATCGDPNGFCVNTGTVTRCFQACVPGACEDLCQPEDTCIGLESGGVPLMFDNGMELGGCIPPPDATAGPYEECNAEASCIAGNECFGADGVDTATCLPDCASGCPDYMGFAATCYVGTMDGGSYCAILCTGGTACPTGMGCTTTPIGELCFRN